MSYFWGVPKYWGPLAAAQSAPPPHTHTPPLNLPLIW